MTRRWMLPEGVEEILPPHSWQLEDVRRRLLDHFRSRGYELIVPPLVEHLDALLTGAGSDLEAQTLKFTDPATGRLLALRADMTPQAARIVARRMNGAGTVRLCYLGSVLRAWPDGPGGSRTPLQVGCEIFGEPDLSADIEIIRLMLESLELAGVRDIHLGKNFFCRFKICLRKYHFFTFFSHFFRFFSHFVSFSSHFPPFMSHFCRIFFAFSSH